MLFRWLGVAGIELRAGSHVLVIDPYLTRVSLWQIAFERLRSHRQRIAAAIPRCDFVLVTHAHFDHLMDVPEVVRHTGAVALGSPNTCQLLEALGVPAKQIREIRVGDALALGDFTVEVLRAEHLKILGRAIATGSLPPRLRPPLRAADYRMDCDFSFLIRAGGLRLLDWAGAGAAPDAPIDVACVNALAPAWPALLHALRPRLVVPIHWEDFLRPPSKPLRPMLRPSGKRFDLAAFRQRVGRVAPETRVFVPEMSCVYALRPDGSVAQVEL